MRISPNRCRTPKRCWPIHHHEAELGERHVLFQQSVGAHDEINLSPPHSVLDLRLLRCLARADQKVNLVRQRPQQRLGVEVMLSGQDLRGGHQGHLIAILNGQDRRLESNDGLPGPHIALQKTIHGPRRTHVVHHLFQHPLLRRRGMERQNAANRGAGAVLGLKLDSLYGLGLAPSQRKARAHVEEFLEDQPHLRGCAEVAQLFEGLAGVREMGLAKCRGAVHQPVLLTHRQGKPVRDAVPEGGQRGPDQPPDDPSAQPSGAFIDRYNPFHFYGVPALGFRLRQYFVLRLNDLQIACAVEVALHLPVKENSLALPEDLALFQVDCVEP